MRLVRLVNYEMNRLILKYFHYFSPPVCTHFLLWPCELSCWVTSTWYFGDTKLAPVLQKNQARYMFTILLAVSFKCNLFEDDRFPSPKTYMNHYTKVGVRAISCCKNHMFCFFYWTCIHIAFQSTACDTIKLENCVNVIEKLQILFNVLSAID